MTIIIDIDDTISNFGEILLKNLNNNHKTDYKKDDIKSWDWYTKNFNNPWKPMEEFTFWDEVKINKKAVECIENLIKNGHKVYLVTASFPSDYLGYKIRKTLENFNSNLLNKNNVIVCYDKGVIKGDIRIDDGFHNLYTDSLNILFNQPWNQNIKSLFPSYIRMNNWEEIEEYLNNFLKNKYNEEDIEIKF